MTFDEVYRRFRQPVWRLARRLTDSEDDALEATQEIFLRVWRGLGGFRGESKLSTWVFQVAWNYLRRYRRQRGGRPSEVPLEVDGAGVAEWLADPAPGPQRTAVASDLLDRVETAIGGLPEPARVVLWLRDGESLSYEEIARVLDVPIGTVRSRLARARAALREALER